MIRFLWASMVLAAVAPALRADDKFFLPDQAQRVVFLGDSNTFAGHYVAYLDAYLFTRFPDRKYELLNLGLPSETACGLLGARPALTRGPMSTNGWTACWRGRSRTSSCCATA